VPQTVSNLRNPQICEVIRLLNTSLFFPRGEKCYRVLDAETGAELTTPDHWEEVKLAARRATAAADLSPIHGATSQVSSSLPSSSTFSAPTSGGGGHHQHHPRQLAALPPPQLVALTVQLGGASTAASQIVLGERKWIQAVSRRRQSVSPSNRNTATSSGSSSGNGRCISPTQLQDNTHNERLCDYATSVLRLVPPSAGSNNNSMFGAQASTVLVPSPRDQHKQLLLCSGRPTSPGSGGLTTSPTSKQHKQHHGHWLHQQHHVLHHHHHHHHLQQHSQPSSSQQIEDISPPASTSNTKSKRLMHDNDDSSSAPPPSSNLNTQPPMAALASSTFKTESSADVNDFPPSKTHFDIGGGFPSRNEPARFVGITITGDANSSTDTLEYKTQSFPKPSPQTTHSSMHHHHHHHHSSIAVHHQHHHHRHHHHHHHHHQHHGLSLSSPSSSFKQVFMAPNHYGSGVFTNCSSSPAPPILQMSPPMHRSAVSLVNAIARDRGAALIDRIADVIEEREFLAEEEKRVGGVTRLVGVENSNMIIAPGSAGRRRPSGTAASASGAMDISMLAPLVEMGFSTAASRYALRRCGGHNVEQAIELLLQLTTMEIERVEAKEKALMEKEKHQQHQQQQESMEEEHHLQQMQLQQVHSNTPRLPLKKLLSCDELQRRLHVSKLIDMGFTGQSSRDALRRADGDFDTACIFLLEDASHPTNSSSGSNRRHHDRGSSHDHSDSHDGGGAMHHGGNLPLSSTNGHAMWYDPIEAFIRKNEIAAENALTVIRAINDSPQNVFLVWHCFTLGSTVSKMASVFNGGAPTTATPSTTTTATVNSMYSAVGPTPMPSVSSVC
jgi:hypothetical protein